MTPLAHSPRRCVPAQSYLEHIENVRQRAKDNAERATAYHTEESARFIRTVEAAAIYHDLGKLARIIHDGPKQAIQATSAGQSSR